MTKYRLKASLTIISLLIIAAAASLLGYLWLKSPQPRHKQTTKVIVTQPVKHKTQKSLSITGHLIAHNATSITSHNPGFIKAILFHEGDYVKKGQPLILLDPTKIKAELQSDAAQLEADHNKYAIEKRLHQKGVISQAKLQQQHAKQAKSQAQLQEDEATLKEMIIRAPFSGYLGAKTINIGDHITDSKKLVHIVDRDHLLVKYHVPAKYIHTLDLGQVVAIKGDVYTFKGQISFIAPNIDPDTGTVEVHARVKNKHNKLWPGKFVTVKQPVSQPKSHLLIPEQAILSSLGSHYVLTAHQGKAHKHKVKLGQNYGGCVVIQSGLSTTDELIIAGEHQVHDEQPIKIAKHKKAEVCNS